MKIERFLVHWFDLQVTRWDFIKFWKILFQNLKFTSNFGFQFISFCFDGQYFWWTESITGFFESMVTNWIGIHVDNNLHQQISYLNWVIERQYSDIERKFLRFIIDRIFLAEMVYRLKQLINVNFVTFISFFLPVQSNFSSSAFTEYIVIFTLAVKLRWPSVSLPMTMYPISSDLINVPSPWFPSFGKKIFNLLETFFFFVYSEGMWCSNNFCLPI